MQQTGCRSGQCSVLLYSNCLVSSISHPRTQMQHESHLLTQAMIQVAMATEAYQVAPVFALVRAPPYAIAVAG